MTDEKAKEGRARIVASTAPIELRDVQFVIEAASEKFEIKKEIFRDLAMKVGPKTILATNTSALPVGEARRQNDSPERVIGLHFFNPVSRMKLVEVVIGETDVRRDARAKPGLCQANWKTAGDCSRQPGFSGQPRVVSVLA